MSLRLGGLNMNDRNQVISPLSEIGVKTGVDTGVDTYRVMVSTPTELLVSTPLLTRCWDKGGTY